MIEILEQSIVELLIVSHPHLNMSNHEAAYFNYNLPSVDRDPEAELAFLATISRTTPVTDEEIMRVLRDHQKAWDQTPPGETPDYAAIRPRTNEALFSIILGKDIRTGELLSSDVRFTGNQRDSVRRTGELLSSDVRLTENQRDSMRRTRTMIAPAQPTPTTTATLQPINSTCFDISKLAHKQPRVLLTPGLLKDYECVILGGTVTQLPEGVITPNVRVLEIDCFKASMVLHDELDLFVHHVCEAIPTISKGRVFLHASSHELGVRLGPHYLFNRYGPIGAGMMEKNKYSISEENHRIRVGDSDYYYVKRVPLVSEPVSVQQPLDPMISELHAIHKAIDHIINTLSQ